METKLSKHIKSYSSQSNTEIRSSILTEENIDCKDYGIIDFYKLLVEYFNSQPLKTMISILSIIYEPLPLPVTMCLRMEVSFQHVYL